jgi:hypothetical protein
MGLKLRDEPIYFWFGSGIHWALEDFHGYNRYGHAGKAFLAYVEATKACKALPDGWEEHVPLGLGMMSYYSDYWLRHRSPLETLWLDDVPQCEVNAQIDLGVTYKGHRVVYGITIDRMTVDAYGQLWIHEYKTAKAFNLYHFDLDEQITSYVWGATKVYGEKPAGVVYLQYRKHIPQMPRILSTGKISVDKKQPTTAPLFRQLLTDMFGSINSAPQEYIPFLNHLTAEEEAEADRFIRRDYIERNVHEIRSFEERIHMELEDMLNENLPLYPNRTRGCVWSCPLQHVCLAMEDGSDYQDTLRSYVGSSDGQYYFNEVLKWRQVLPPPEQVVLPEEAQMYAQLIQESQQLPREGQQALPEQTLLEELSHGQGRW